MITFRIFAHRGASADAADNSASAFQLALDQHADLIETDIRLTSDGVLILEHDEDFGGLLIADATIEELREVKPELLTLASALAQFGGKIPFCWEIKSPGIESAVVNLIRDLTPAVLWQKTEFTSFVFKTAVTVRKLVQSTPDVSVGWLTSDWDETVIARTSYAELTQICPPADRILTAPHLVEIAKKAGLTVRAWQLSTPDLLPRLAEIGVYGATVNFPARARLALTTTN